jgi:hypothetical protein
MAQLEMKAMVVHLFANFEFSLPPDYKKPVPKAAITYVTSLGSPQSSPRLRRMKPESGLCVAGRSAWFSHWKAYTSPYRPLRVRRIKTFANAISEHARV